jgi:hypothetical protein
MYARVALLCVGLVGGWSGLAGAQVTTSSGASLPAASAAAAAAAEPPAQRGDGWPQWVKLGVQHRGRIEGTDGLATVGGRDDAYYLNRIRVDTTLIASPWAKGFLQLQDARVFGYGPGIVPKSHANALDLRQAYVELQRPGRALTLRIGRQEIAYGDQRLVGSLDWANTARSFDGARLTVATRTVSLEGFATAIVRVEPGRFDRWRTDERFYGGVASTERLGRKGAASGYVFVKTSEAMTSERGEPGDGAIYTLGSRLAGGLPRRFDYNIEVALQRGDAAGDSVGAWAGHYGAGWLPLASSARPLRVTAEYNHASGDHEQGDGRRGTFDQLFPTNHNKYGIADQMGWRNMREIAFGVELAPLRTVKLQVDAHQLLLATTRDGLYNAGGVRTVLNRAATSRDVGRELDVQATIAVAKRLSLGAGLSCLVPGRVLDQSSMARTIWSPYVMWSAKF